jgi:hypothetical protein
VDNIFEAKESDFTVGQVTILGSSQVTVGENKAIEMQLPQMKQ